MSSQISYAGKSERDLLIELVVSHNELKADIQDRVLPTCDLVSQHDTEIALLDKKTKNNRGLIVGLWGLVVAAVSGFGVAIAKAMGILS